ncbi:MAG: ABC transporter ATP-binding protein [Myxococcales bacterium]|jgi:iron complex transport system ATP-binding protein
MREAFEQMPLRAESIRVTLGGRTVLWNVDVQADPGQVLALLGPNGAGKSTLLKALAGLLPYQGSVQIGGVEAASLSPKDRAKRVSYVPQRSLLRSSLTVEEVVALGRYVHGSGFGGMSRLDRNAIDSALATTHAHRLRHRLFTQLSVGEQQRVLLARALASDAPILLFDEPTAALDVGEGLSVLRLIRTLAARHHTIVVVLHDLADARTTTDRALLLKDGRVIERGDTKNVVASRPVFAAYGVRLIENARIGFEADAETPAAE